MFRAFKRIFIWLGLMAEKATETDAINEAVVERGIRDSREKADKAHYANGQLAGQVANLKDQVKRQNRQKQELQGLLQAAIAANDEEVARIRRLAADATVASAAADRPARPGGDVDAARADVVAGADPRRKAGPGDEALAAVVPRGDAGRRGHGVQCHGVDVQAAADDGAHRLLRFAAAARRLGGGAVT